MPTPTCLNLRELFGKRFRVMYEESYHAQYGPGARREDPHLMILLCRYGHLFAWQGNELAASVDGHPNVADFAKVARIMRPRRRRQVSQAQRDRLRAMGFQKGRQDHAHVQPTAQGCVPGAQEDLEPVRPQRSLF